ncbi:MAG TPA: RNA polymerase sigma factor [Actinocrinis sp.]|uniref:RNA polymerase sigma factor n=1 Tax=Actinocrinis sp. TaxID=1920516 RepID=UPI002D2EAB06|nr:RNA polymerase sigma factor [Actinocrinis sp.]HZU54492.1 RNA polymerase sigma factor [Actinocrinis sp.]
MNQTDERARRAVEAVWRIEAPRLIAGLARTVGDLALAEDLAQDALVAALEQWPGEGVPRNPGAWLMTVGKRRAVDLIRRDQTYARKLELIGADLGADEPEPDAIEDDLLRLVFTACHPVLAPQARVALTLRLLGGLSTADIGRAYLVPEATIAQRIVRAKRLLAQKQVPFEVPAGAQLAERLTSVLEVVYLIFNEGYSATAGDDWMRPALCEEALRLARVLSGLMPAEPEVHGLTALLEIQSSRVAARTGAKGGVVLLADQDRGRWNQLLIRRGFSALAKADATAKARRQAPGPYALQAAIAASHARAITAAETDWATIAGLYDALIIVQPTPVVALNRAVAVAMARGPAAGLALVDELAANDVLKDYHLLPAVRADLLNRLGRYDEAREELERAAPLAQNGAERTLLLERAAALPK